MPDARQMWLPGMTPPPRRRLILMHAVDRGEAPGMMPGWRSPEGARFRCSRCGHDSGWLFDLGERDLRRGLLPCPVCNAPDHGPLTTRRRAANVGATREISPPPQPEARR